MRNYDKAYIDGQWVALSGNDSLDIIDPASEAPVARLQLGIAVDADRAVRAARAAFPAYAATSRQQRLGLLDRIIAGYEARSEELAFAISSEMGAPITLARTVHVPNGLKHLRTARAVLAVYEFDEMMGTTLVTREPVGVCALITPWNWPLNQIGAKVAPALAAGCTMVLKPSEIAPGCALIFAEILHEAGVPRGVFNLVNGTGPVVGAALSAHAEVDMVSFTGSTAAGIRVAKAGADGVKRVALELGGKSADIVLDDAALEGAVRHGARACFGNSGQTCNAPTRLLVPEARLDEAEAIAADVAATMAPDDPGNPQAVMGPVAGRAQFEKVNGLIEVGLAEGARCIAGGPGRPADRERGYYVRPTVFSGVTPAMRVAREEIFGPVLVIMTYDSEDDAVAIANDSAYGLSGYVSAADPDRARALARRLRTGMVHVNQAPSDPFAPFGGYKQSGNGREWGRYGLEEFLEVKSIFGYGATP
jgi:aldehyde dehydrogenase (NAD+)